MALDVTVLANLAIALSVVVALVFGVLQVRAAARDRRERLTLEVIRGLQTREFASMMVGVVEHESPPETTEGWRALPREKRVLFLHFAQEMEMLGLLVYDGTIELELVERTLGNFVTAAFEKYRAGFESLRATLPDPYLGEYFEWLAHRVDSRMSDRPRAPAYAEKPARRA
ncbi:MAG: DUF4760 domain-containing protein [Thermoplasmatota archaeon]